MNNSVKIKCPAKINLTLEVLNRRSDGFHDINSIMQLINLFDYITINIEHAQDNIIILNGNSQDIPYDNKNLVYKAANLYLKKYNIQNIKLKIYIEKNIPIAAGLAGGSTDAAGTLLGLNHFFKKANREDLDELCSLLGSDLNVCLQGGCVLAQSRGEKIQELPCLNYNLTLIKPKNIGISAKEAYTKFDMIKDNIYNNYTNKMIENITKNIDIKEFLYNDLEKAVYNDYNELQLIKTKLPTSIMSGSGPTYFILENINNSPFNNNYEFINNLHFINYGVEVI